MTKGEIRAEMKRREALFSPVSAERETEEIWNGIEESESFRLARTILSYMAIAGEVPTVRFMQKWMGVKRFAIPLVAGDSLEFREYDPDRLVQGYMGIQEPSADSPVIFPYEIDLAIVPGVAFARVGGKLWRMGRGKGFYDRTLPLLKCRKTGVFFSFRLLDEIPVDSWDLPLDI